MHPQDYFNGNPYILTKPLPPMRKTGTSSGPKNVTPFKPSSPGKKVLVNNVKIYDDMQEL